jgi:alanine racemase
MRPTLVKVNLARLEHNIHNLISLIPADTAFMAIVKANAYGHGAEKIAKHAVKAGASWLGVALPEEGAELREKGLRVPILVLGEISREQCTTVVQYDLVQAIPSLHTASWLNQAALRSGQKVKVHLKLDTGMNRIGFRSLDEINTAAIELRGMKGLSIEGAFTHFATADEEDSEFTLRQVALFEDMVKILGENQIHPYILHASNSAGILSFSEAYFNLVRGGISIYGYYPSTNLRIHAKTQLLPILQWETRIVHIKTIEAGSSISYGRSYFASDNMRVATLPVGYADGYNRLLSNRGYVLIRGKRAPIIGRICMDQCMVDITAIPDAEVGDTVVLLGEQGQESICADEMADICETISYEILTSISERVPRVYIES